MEMFDERRGIHHLRLEVAYLGAVPNSAIRILEQNAQAAPTAGAPAPLFRLAGSSEFSLVGARLLAVPVKTRAPRGAILPLWQPPSTAFVSPAATCRRILQGQARLSRPTRIRPRSVLAH
jgi:hypothetical protein